MEDTTYFDGCHYQVGMLLADDRSHLTNNYLSVKVQLKSIESRLDRERELQNSYAQTIVSDLDKSHIIYIDRKDCFKVDYRTIWFSTLINPVMSDVCLMEQRGSTIPP